MKSSKIIPYLLVTCIVIVVLWEVAASRSRQPFSPFTLTRAEFSTFRPQAPGWSIEPVELQADDPSAPNLMAFMMTRTGAAGGGRESAVPVLVRLVHGYNMPDCMRLKGYKVELVGDTNEGASLRSPELPVTAVRDPLFLPRIQTWRLTSDIGDKSVWCSTMIRAGDFGGTDLDVRDMAFPRIAGPIGSEWEITGFSSSSLSHPVKSFVMLCKVKWNNARCDLLTFLKLRQPAWASNEHLTFLAASRVVRVEPGVEDRIIGEVRAAQAAFYAELCRWKAERP